MSQPIEKIRSEGRQQVCIGGCLGQFKKRILSKRKLRNAVQSVRVTAHKAVKGILGQTRGPRFVEPLFKSATLVRPPIMIVARGHDRTNSRQMWRMCNRRQHLGGPDIGASIHSYSAVGVG